MSFLEEADPDEDYTVHAELLHSNGYTTILKLAAAKAEELTAIHVPLPTARAIIQAASATRKPTSTTAD